MIQWRKGDADNFRAADGASVWDRKPDRGWTVEAGGYTRAKVPSTEGLELAPGIRALVHPLGPPFPGGMIDVEDGHLIVRVSDAV